MNCCVECFKDTEIRTIIRKNNNIGNCNFCGSLNIPIYRIGSEENSIELLFLEILSIYGVSETESAKPLKKALKEDWDLFSLGSEDLLLLTKQLCLSGYEEDSEIFSRDVKIIRLENREFLRRVALIGGKTWQEFSEYIKTKNRFHASMFNAVLFEKYLEAAERRLCIDEVMYRARISPDMKGFETNKMGAPPNNKRTSGRVNPEGIGALYLSHEKETVLHEVRASTLDYISVGTFKLLREAKIVDLAEISRISPLNFMDDLEQYAANRRVFQDIAIEIAKPLRRNDSPLEYLPTQYITEFIKSKSYDGVEYPSTLIQGGRNIAIFDERLFECISVETLEVYKIKYETKPAL